MRVFEWSMPYIKRINEPYSLKCIYLICLNFSSELVIHVNMSKFQEALNFSFWWGCLAWERQNRRVAKLTFVANAMLKGLKFSNILRVCELKVLNFLKIFEKFLL